MGTLREKIKGTPVKEKSGFQYHRGSICRISPDDVEPVDEVIEHMKKEISEKGVVLCPRCGTSMEQRPDKKWGCPSCGLTLTAEVLKKFNLKI